MTNVMNNELAKRAVACKHWQLLPGMFIQTIKVNAFRPRQGRTWRINEYDEWSCSGELDWLPDLKDPATLGCILSLVRKRWNWPNAFTCCDETGWRVNSGEKDCSIELQDEVCDGERYDTEAEALVAALEAAP